MDLTSYLDPDIMAKIQTGGYFLMFILMIIEGPIVTFISAFLASLGVFDIWMVFFLGFSGDIIGDLIFYAFGYLTGHHTKISAFLSQGIIGKIQSLAQNNLIQALIVIKYTPYLPPIGLSMIGAMHMPFGKYLSTTVLLSIIGPLIFGLSGYYLGLINILLPKTTGGIVILVFIFISFLLGIYVLYKWLTKKYAQKLLIYTEKL